MKRSATFFASLVLSTAMIGCGEPATPPAGKMDSATGADIDRMDAQDGARAPSFSH